MNREQQVETAQQVIEDRVPADDRYSTRKLAETIVDRLSPSGAGEELRTEADLTSPEGVELDEVALEAADKAFRQGFGADRRRLVRAIRAYLAASPSGADPQPDLTKEEANAVLTAIATFIEVHHRLVDGPPMNPKAEAILSSAYRKLQAWST